MKNEINSLIIERDILTKTIFRVYQQDTQITKIQRDKLLTRYQHQLGVVIAQIEKLGEVTKRASLSPSDDGIFAAMNQKLSRMDERLQEISSQISPPNQEVEKPRRKLSNMLPKKGRRKSQSQNTIAQRKNIPLEITTLTEVPSKIPEFFRKLNPSKTKIEVIEHTTDQEAIETIDNIHEVKITQPNICEHPNCDNPKFSNKHCSIHTSSYLKKSTEEKKLVPIPDFEVKKSQEETETNNKLPDDDSLDGNDDDISKITNDIEKALSNLNQAEVE